MSSVKRQRTQTVKGRLYELEIRQEERRKQESSIRKEIKEIEDLFSTGNKQILCTKYDGLQKQLVTFMSIHARCQQLVEDEDTRYHDEEVVARLNNDVQDLEKKLKSVLCDISEELPGNVEVMEKAVKSRSVKTTSSKRLSTSSARSLQLLAKEERAHLAELKLEAEYLKRMQEAEFAAKQIKVELDIAKASAKLKIFEIDDDKSVAGQKDFNKDLPGIPEIEKKELVQSYLEKLPFGDENLHKSSEASLPSRELNWERHRMEEDKAALDRNPVLPADKDIGSVAELLCQMQAPDVDIDTFDGNPLEFLSFMAVFEEAVERKVKDQRGCLMRLLKYLIGDPKDLVSSCIYMPRETCFKEAKNLLKARYGDPYKIICEYRKQLKQWPKIKPNDSSNFKKFHTFLVKFKATMDYSGSDSFDSPEFIQMLQTKLPVFLQDRWNRQAYEIRRRDYQEPRFHHFMRMLETEVCLVSDPLYSREALGENPTEGKEKSSGRSKMFKTFLSTASEDSMCPLCDSNHDLDDCAAFLKKTVEQRRKFLFHRRLCFCCYKPIKKKHSAKNCQNRRKCDVCHEEHPTGLHGYVSPNKASNRNPSSSKDDDQTNVVSARTTAKEATISLSVVPIKIYSKDQSVVIKTHALLDNGSQGSFIKEDLMKELKAVGIATSIRVKTLNGEEVQQSNLVHGLSVSSINDPKPSIRLPGCYSQKELPVEENEVPTPKKVAVWHYLREVAEHLPKDDKIISVGVLLGGNCPSALEPVQVISSREGGPYAFKTKLGWCVTGPIAKTSPIKETKCNRIAVKNIAEDKIAEHYFCVERKITDQALIDMQQRMYRHDFNEHPGEAVGTYLSQDDLKFMEIMQQEVQFINGHYQIPLPFRNEDVNFVNNRGQAIQRAEWLKKRLTRNEKMHTDYNNFMQNLIEKGYAKKVQKKPQSGKCWYLPHFGIYHPKKPEKIRVVLDCSATFKEMSLNKKLIQGPDLTNHLIGVLVRFRKEEVAIMGDIESMFYQVRVPEVQYDFLRLLWWPDGNLDKELQDFVMCVHIFGAVSSPSCSNYALKRTAKDNELEFGKDAADTLRKNFYVDDMLKSCSSAEKAKDLLSRVIKMCAAGGFHLTKILSNSREVLQDIDETERGKVVKELDLSSDVLPIERALGVHWCIENDCLGFRITLKDKPLTRRGILSTVSSIYDPLGFAAPFLLQGKILLQQLCSDKIGWDDAISCQQRYEWERWRLELPGLEQVKISRCLKPKNFGEVVNQTIHHFSDASDKAYGQASYLRLENKEGKVVCSLLMGKSRVKPMKATTIPRLELTAAVVSVKVGSLLKSELDIKPLREFYWSDSEVVLGYIKNESKRFHMFVTNRVATILDKSRRDQWNYVESKANPADDASRGLSISKYVKNKRWFTGPAFLQKPLDDLEKGQKRDFMILEQDPEVKDTAKVNRIGIEDSLKFLSHLISRTSSWFKLKRVVAQILRWKTKKGNIEVQDLQSAEIKILTLVQRGCFHSEINLLHKESHENDGIRKSSSLYKLNPFLDQEGIIRVGGRLKHSYLDFGNKHPVILPRSHPVTNMIIQWCHANVQHAGRGCTLNEVRNCGFWAVGANSLVRKIIFQCVKCKLLRGKTSIQKMANLPYDRLETVPVFTYCGIDMFGPFIIKEGRKEVKRYGALFTCLTSRAVHIECTNSLETDSFLQALRRFIARRGNIRRIRCDNGTNFIGAENELLVAWKKMDQKKVTEFLQAHGTDWIKWERNPPASSHFGGVWERQIRTARSILSSLLKNHGLSLNDESFRTILVEVEGIINSRPLTVEVLSDATSPLPLAPINLLTMKSKVIMPPFGEFQQADLYCRKRWRRVQHICNEFWTRWRKEYLSSLQQRQKWQKLQRNYQPGDVVLLKGQTEQRNDWKISRVITVFPDSEGCVRSVTLRTASGQELTRPIHKLVLLVENNDHTVSGS